MFLPPPPVDNKCRQCSKPMGLEVVRIPSRPWLFVCTGCYMGKVYYVKHDNLYANGDDMFLWHKQRDHVSETFNTFESAKEWANKIKNGPRQVAGLGSRSRVVSVKKKARRG